MAKFVKLRKKIFSRGKVVYKKSYVFASKRPIASFLILLGVLLFLIIASNLINKPKVSEEELSAPVKEVSVYAIGTSPKIEAQAKIEKSGVIKIVALSPGVVSHINTQVGQEVQRGVNLISLSTNYQGGNSFSVQRQLAALQYKNAKETFDTQKDLIRKQKDIANKSDENSDKLREISAKSVSETQSLINLNNEVLSALSANQASLEAANVGGVNDPQILQVKQLRSQFEAGNLQLRSSLRNTEFSSSSDNAPASISNITREIAVKQLEIQEKALELNKEVARLSLILAQINEAMMFPSAPINGVVERIFVKSGQAVVPGTPLLQISGESKNLIAVALLSRNAAFGISRARLSTLKLGEKTYESAPFYVSSEATDGQLYTAHFAIPSEFSKEITDGSYITIEVPIGLPETGSAIPFVPIDSVFQTQDESFLFVIRDGKAQSKKVRLGQVLGRFVEIEEGLSESDQVILQRNVVSGDMVSIRK